jgi:DNA-binding MarR family transcriptional regulator
MTNSADQAALNEALALMHFGFRALVAEPDRILASHQLSRAHHRLLFFVSRNPQCSVGQLLEAMAISKQALARPLRDLLEHGLLQMRPDASDRRVRRLALTAKGRALERQLSDMQRRMLAAVFEDAGPAMENGWREVMRRLAEPLHRFDPAP